MFSLVPGSNVALIVEGLCKTYGKAIAGGPLSFSLTVGSTTRLLGGNGAGKTTTIGMNMGLIEPTSGSIRVFGHDMAHERHHVLGHEVWIADRFSDRTDHLGAVRIPMAVFGSARWVCTQTPSQSIGLI
jgi:ABC-type branched-subunit amino acid transport system ATPase component